MTKKILIKVKNINKKHNMQQVLCNVNMEVCEKEMSIITGISGSGKSTLLHILGLLESHDSGKVDFLLNQNSKNKALFRLNNMGFVYQFAYLLQDFSVIENVMIPSLLKGQSSTIAKEKSQYLLKKVGLEKKAKSMPSTLSGGEAQRVAIARALINDPKVIIADEPTANLDTQNAQQIMQIMHESTIKGSACIIATHDISIKKFANKNYTISNGFLQLQK